jgi:hypothetical protein
MKIKLSILVIGLLAVSCFTDEKLIIQPNAELRFSVHYKFTPQGAEVREFTITDADSIQRIINILDSPGANGHGVRALNGMATIEINLINGDDSSLCYYVSLRTDVGTKVEKLFCSDSYSLVRENQIKSDIEPIIDSLFLKNNIILER